MLFFDECIPEKVCAAIRLLDIPSTDVREQGLRGAEDECLPAAALRLGAIFVTYDLDFTTRPLFAALASAGICVVLIRRSKGADLAEVAEVVLRYRRQWVKSCGAEPTVVSCSLRGGCRARRVADLPYRVRPPVPPRT
jgi:predicted nuclease of predicted toxin-antitoxin system